MFSFSKTDKVWGLSRWITVHMVSWWIEQVGPRPYLLLIKQSYDDGYNHADFSQVQAVDKAELRELVHTMLQTGYERHLSLDHVAAAHVRENLVELRRLLNGDLEGTPLYQEIPDWTESRLR